MTSPPARKGAARPQLIRAMNEQLLLEQVRYSSPLSRAELARISGLSKPTVALALANLEQDGLVRVAGHRTGVRGPAAVLYEVRPEAGYVLGLEALARAAQQGSFRPVNLSQRTYGANTSAVITSAKRQEIAYITTAYACLSKHGRRTATAEQKMSDDVNP